MALEPLQVYDSLLFSYSKDPDHPLWTLNGPFSGDLIAGLVVGMSTIINNIIVNYEREVNYIINIVNRKELISIDAQSALQFEHVLHEYIAYNDIFNDQLIEYQHNVDLGYYGWWIRDYLEYSLYQFQTVDFIQGFISICNAFEVDFRDYIAGPPFQSDNKGNNIPYNIIGYDIEPFNPPVRIPGPPEPFYTDAHEVDGDNDFE